MPNIVERSAQIRAMWSDTPWYCVGVLLAGVLYELCMVFLSQAVADWCDADSSAISRVFFHANGARCDGRSIAFSGENQ